MTSEFGIAVHALVYLNRCNRTVCSEALSKTVCTNPARIRKIMSRLKAAGLVGAKEGPDGGYFMVRRPESITLDMLLFALDVQLITPGWRSGDLDMDCVVASGMANVMEDLYHTLNQACLNHLHAISISDIDLRIFANTPPGKKTAE